MASEYNARKERLAGTPKAIIGDVDAEIQRARSSTPKPVSRTLETTAVPEGIVKKIAYKHEIDDIKTKLDLVQSSHQSFTQSFAEMLEQSKKDIALIVDPISQKVDENKRQIESMKVESLKNALNERITKMNEQLVRISRELVSSNDSISELKSRIQSIEDLF